MMSALDNLINGTKIFFAVHEYTRPPELAEAAAELAQLRADLANFVSLSKTGLSLMEESKTALDEAQRVIEKLALLNWGFPIERDACAWLKKYSDCQERNHGLDYEADPACVCGHLDSEHDREDVCGLCGCDNYRKEKDNSAVSRTTPTCRSSAD